MKELKQYGIVLRTTPWRDADVLLTLLTPELGRITASARAARQNHRRFSGSCDLLDYGLFTLKHSPSSGYYQVTGIEDRRSWPGIREDLTGFVLASYCLELVLLFALEEDREAGQLLRQLLRTLQSLERERTVGRLVAICVYFHLSLLRFAGLNILDHPSHIPGTELKQWLASMISEGSPIVPYEQSLLSAGLRSLHQFTANETGAELRSYRQLMRPEILGAELSGPAL